MKFKIFWLVVLCVSIESQAGIFKITNRNYGLATPYAQYIDPIFDELEAKVNAFLPMTDNSTFMKHMADAVALSGAANVANYGSPIDIFQLGAQAGVAVGAQNPPSGGKFTLNDIKGFGVQGTALLGLHLSLFDGNNPYLKNMWGYLGFFTYNFSQDKINAKYVAFTLYGQYRLKEPQSWWWGTVKWNGLFVGSGVRYENIKASFTDVLATQTSSMAVSSIPGNPTVTASYTGVVSAGVDVSTVSIPAEISTSMRLLYILTPFVGFGADINTGLSKSTGTVVAPVTVTESTATYGSLSGTGYLDIGDQSPPTFLGLRLFTGLQLELGVVALNISTTRNFITKDVAYNVGLKAYW